METEAEAEYKTGKPKYQQVHIRLPVAVHQWYKTEAARQRRSVNAEMIMALEFWKNAREATVT
jgi:hypothetical protein